MTTDLGQESVRMGPRMKPPPVIALYLSVAVMCEESAIGSGEG